jgi:hypothetical protein
MSAEKYAGNATQVAESDLQVVRRTLGQAQTLADRVSALVGKVLGPGEPPANPKSTLTAATKADAVLPELASSAGYASDEMEVANRALYRLEEALGLN